MAGLVTTRVRARRRPPRHAAAARDVPTHLPPELALRTPRNRRLAVARYARPRTLGPGRFGAREERVRWAASALVAAVVAVLGLVGLAIAPLGIAPGPTQAAADGFDPGYRSTQDLTDPAAARVPSPEAYARSAPQRSSRDLARTAALAANQQAARADELITAAADRTAADQIGRQSARDTALAKSGAASQAEAARLLAKQLADEQRAKLAAIRAEERAKAGLQPDATPTTDAPDPTATSAAPTQTSSSGAAASPITNGVIGARFGQVGLWASYHTGLDYRASYGTPIHAAADGVVTIAGNTGDWAGNHVAIRHADGTSTMYSHMSSMDARVGESVTAGQVIGYVGSTGRAFGAHLHFEVYPAGVQPGDVYRAINPMPWLTARGVRVG